jgi:hypothetical protein
MTTNKRRRRRPQMDTRQRRNKRLPTLDLRQKQLSHLHCSPVAEKKGHLPGSCYSTDTVLEMRDAYNEIHRDGKDGGIVENDPVKVHRALKTRLADKCGDNEECWLKETISNDQRRKDLDKTLFSPSKPSDWQKDPTRWLSNFDIEAVLKQYEEAYPEFKLLGPTVLDYDAKLGDGACVDDDLCHFSLDSWIQRGKTKLAVSFNLSKHDEPGTHWTTLFIDVANKLVYYYDSALNPMPSQINKFKKTVLRQGKRLGIAFQFHKNNHQHQKTNTECGMYSLFFTIVMLTGKISTTSNTVMAPKECVRIFSQMIIPDDVMQDHRSVYFSD